MQRIHENDVEKRQNVSEIIHMSKFAKILIDALVAIFGTYGVDFLLRRVHKSGVDLYFIEK